MAYCDLQLLDCTLRDGGYINNWNWGYDAAKSIIHFLVKAGIEVVEVGFLRNVDVYNPDISVCDYIEELNKLLPVESGNTMFSAMIMQSNYDIDKLSQYSGCGIEMIRVTAHDYDIEEGMEFARKVKEKGYKLSINPINIMGYSDEKILWMIEQVNQIQPYQFAIVDTFGSMKRRDLDRIVSLVDNNLNRNIRLSLHLHENMSLGSCLAQNFVDKHLNRPIAIDASLMGMGRMPGNLPIELISDYLNDYLGKRYNIDYLMDAIYDYIAPEKGKSEWGYSPVYFLSARYNLHRNYAEFYLEKGSLTNRDINHILSRIAISKKTAFDKKYAEALYEDYNNNRIDDSRDVEALKALFQGRNILIIAPGKSIVSNKNVIYTFIENEDPIVISVNFYLKEFQIDYAFYSNIKRFMNEDEVYCKTIVTSNITNRNADYYINYNSVSGTFEQGCNSLIMLLKLLCDIGIVQVAIAGADGYIEEGDNYYSSTMKSTVCHGSQFNVMVANAIKKLGVKIKYLTPSKYDI